MFRRQADEVEQLQGTLAPLDLLLALGRSVEQHAEQVGRKAAVHADEHVLQHGHVLKQANVLKRAGDPGEGDHIRSPPRPLPDRVRPESTDEYPAQQPQPLVAAMSRLFGRDLFQLSQLDLRGVGIGSRPQFALPIGGEIDLFAITLDRLQVSLRERERLGIVVARRQRLLEIGSGHQQPGAGCRDDLPAASSPDETRLAAKLSQRIASRVGPVELPAFASQELSSAELPVAVVVASRESFAWFQGCSVVQLAQRDLSIRVRVVLREVSRRFRGLPRLVVVVVLDRHTPDRVDVGHHQHRADSREQGHRRAGRIDLPSSWPPQFAIVEDDLTTRGGVDAGDGVEDGRLPRAVGADD